jgi:hypothetical protein
MPISHFIISLIFIFNGFSTFIIKPSFSYHFFSLPIISSGVCMTVYCSTAKFTNLLMYFC